MSSKAMAATESANRIRKLVTRRNEGTALCRAAELAGRGA